MDDGGGINGYEKRTRENIVSLSKIIDLEGCLTYLKFRCFVTFKKQRWLETNKLAARSALRLWEVAIYLHTWKFMQIFFKKPLNNYVKILS